jgi:hypothetical protein
MRLVFEVITSMASMKMSALIEIPRKRYIKKSIYITPISGVGSREIPGLLIIPE